MTEVLFVCMGNICRSPTAQAVFEHVLMREGLADRIRVDSAGTHAYHIGNPPDKRATEAALRRGIDLSVQRARRVTTEDFDNFDYVLVMDQQNLRDLPTPGANARAKVQLFMDFAPHWPEREVPDPYYGGAQGFERVLDMIEDASKGLLQHIK
ncbi:protein tyrosine phosphatase [Ectothiorhodosinus mongolicus]|uniref:protein-tyrosine-phosphatase n=1 Tax=Ectothiorhodosinus mongolicus TaxID=233100 RepID=A0A1R3VMC0_9GAMM|nr:low molecular weight protein-tyrosine-phosphatase [Ectothiorhodosinus mongolicus]ULX57781.1 low molecular weight phosphotyrosine protein phosphatase [Ectothiorhodosinus mongolicus]SIT65644.1 protein tyrosine phosphatase [Ectothiorhodosinus mongolicus]